jgi:long-subunit fatty acid transport protein
VFELTFSSPGARSMGFGGAFVPLADDATAAFANPAGLVQLVRPELSGELRMRAAVESDENGQSAFGAVTGLSFFSLVYPRGRWSLALYGHQLANLEFAVERKEQTAAARASAATAERIKELSVARLGLAGALRVTDTLSLGVGVSRFSGRLAFAPLQDAGGPTRRSDSTDWGVNAGILWNPSQRFRLGGFFREGPELAIGTGSTAITRVAAPDPVTTLELPDTYGLGTAFRSRDGALTVAFEWDRVRYAKLLPGLAAIAGGDEGLVLRDASEYHVGAEYAFLRVNPVLAARLGAWLEPDHRACSSTSGSPYQCTGKSRDELHGTAGFGLAFRRFQLDIGIDGSRSMLAFSISGIVSF